VVHVFLYLPLLLGLATDSRQAPTRKPEPVRVLGACGTVTRADVERALGRQVSAGKEEPEGAGSTCHYSGGKGMVTVTVQRLTAKLNMAFEIASLKDEIPESRVREVAGIGTAAFFLDIADYGTQLHVVRGETEYLLVSVLGFGDAPQVSAAAEMMVRRGLERF
jgi:hypothetical protein